IALPGYVRSARKSCGCGHSHTDPGGVIMFRMPAEASAATLRRMEMKLKAKSALLTGALIASAVAAALGSSAALAQAKEQFFPVLWYPPGAYAPNGVPHANGFVDYLKLINARDGGINGVKITFPRGSLSRIIRSEGGR